MRRIIAKPSEVTPLTFLTELTSIHTNFARAIVTREIDVFNQVATQSLDIIRRTSFFNDALSLYLDISSSVLISNGRQPPCCALCRKQPPIGSHTVAANFLKISGILSGYVRRSDRSDFFQSPKAKTFKKPIFCGSCDNVLVERLESRFAEQVLKPFIENGIGALSELHGNTVYALITSIGFRIFLQNDLSHIFSGNLGFLSEEDNAADSIDNIAQNIFAMRQCILHPDSSSDQDGFGIFMYILPELIGRKLADIVEVDEQATRFIKSSLMQVIPTKVEHGVGLLAYAQFGRMCLVVSLNHTEQDYGALFEGMLRIKPSEPIDISQQSRSWPPLIQHTYGRYLKESPRPSSATQRKSVKETRNRSAKCLIENRLPPNITFDRHKQEFILPDGYELLQKEYTDKAFEISFFVVCKDTEDKKVALLHIYMPEENKISLYGLNSDFNLLEGSIVSERRYCLREDIVQKLIIAFMSDSAHAEE
ncbi:hypothetical protein HOC37_02350 [bacterium]|jgi:hypothetical protein|nr:hypothetical protein [bacterium]